VRTQREGSHLQTRKRALTRTWSFWHPDLELPASGTVRNKCWLNTQCMLICYGSLNWQGRSNCLDLRKSEKWSLCWLRINRISPRWRGKTGITCTKAVVVQPSKWWLWRRWCSFCSTVRTVSNGGWRRG
jgi:hypothetical protein